jgi:hypothetical protein
MPAPHQTTRTSCGTSQGHVVVVVACWFAPQGDFGARFSGLAGEVTPRVLAKEDFGAAEVAGGDPRCTELIPKPIPALSHCCAPHPMRSTCTRTRPEIVNVSGDSSQAWWAQGGQGGFRLFMRGVKIAHLTAQPPPCMFDTRAAHANYGASPFHTKCVAGSIDIGTHARLAPRVQGVHTWVRDSTSRCTAPTLHVWHACAAPFCCFPTTRFHRHVCAPPQAVWWARGGQCGFRAFLWGVRNARAP